MLKRTCNEEEGEEQNATTVHSERERDRDNYVCYKYSFKLNIYIFWKHINITFYY